MKNKISKKIVTLAAFFLALSFTFSLPVLGAGTPDDLWGGEGSSIKSYIKENSGLPASQNTGPVVILTNLIKYVLGFLGILAVVIVLYAGFKWMTSGGSEDKIGDAKNMLISGFIGLVIIVLAYTITNFVINQIYHAISK